MKALVPSAQEDKQLRNYAQSALATGFFNGLQNPQQALMVILKGYEMGMGPMEALTHINIIKGKPTMSAESMLAKIHKRVKGAIVNWPELTNEAVTCKAKRPGGDWVTVRWTMDDAKRAGLVRDGSGWTKYPRAMLRSRCVSEIARTVFPDATMGVSYTPEEMGADVDYDGNILQPGSTVSDTSSVREVQEVATPAPTNYATPVVEEYEPAPEMPTSEPQWADEQEQWPEPVGEGTGASHVISGGAWEGKTLESVGFDQVKNKVAFFTKDGKGPRGWCKKMVDNFNIWEASMTKNAPPTVDMNEELPI